MSASNRKGTILGVVLIYMLIITVLGYGLIHLSYSNAIQTDKFVRSNRAFWIADAGIEQVLCKLATDAAYRAAPTSYSGHGPIVDADSSYSITANTSSDPYVFTSCGTASGTNRSITYSIPKALYYAIYSGKQVKTQGSNVIITGDYVESGDKLPTVDYSCYEAAAQAAGQYVSGDKSFPAGTYSGVWYVTGKVDISSGTAINGSIITTDSIYIDSNVTVTAPLPYPALVSAGKIDFPNDGQNIHITGLVYSGDSSGNFLGQKVTNVVFNGAIITPGQVMLQNTIDTVIIYNPAVIANPPPGFLFPGVSSGSNSSYWREIPS